jgi:hypothetical protein
VCSSDLAVTSITILVKSCLAQSLSQSALI